MIPVLGVPILNQPDTLYRMLQSMDEPVRHLVVIDNGECVSRTTLHGVAKAERVTLLQFPWNQGVAGSWNTIIKSTPFAPYWLIVNFDVTWPPGSLAAFKKVADPAALVLSAGEPPWCAFALGEDVVRTVGLFDEGIHPAYFEDNDYMRRCDALGAKVAHSHVAVNHDNSTTIRHAVAAAGNHRTFRANANYYGSKVIRRDTAAGTWSLDTRRELSWD